MRDIPHFIDGEPVIQTGGDFGDVYDPNTGEVQAKVGLAGEPLIWHVDPRTQPTRHPHPNSGHFVRGVEEKLEHVAAGRGISFLPRSATAFYSRPDISYVPIPELAPDQVCLAVAESRESPLVEDFLAAARAVSEATAQAGAPA